MLYDNLRKIEPYVPGEQPKFKNIIKLNTNENPYPPSKNVIEAIKNFDGNSLRLYPDPDIKELSDVWANYINESYEGMNINSDNVFIGVGSDDVLSVAFQTFFNSGKPVLFPNITYSFYDVWCDVYNIPYKTIPLKNDFTINADGYNIANGGIVIANPNAPTGIELSKDYIKKILDNNRDVVVIVDEAYVDFGGESMIPLINEYENLVVVQTFSKSRSMAGARLGGAFADKRLIKAMKDVKFSINSYTISNLFIKAGIASIEDDEYFKTQVGKIVNTRENAKIKLKELGFEVTDSKTNFLWATHKDVSAKVIYEKLKEEKIFVRYFNKTLIDNYLRITIGTDEEMEKLYKALGNVIM